MDDRADARRKWLRWSLRRYLLAVLVAFALGPLLASNVWGYLTSRRYLTRAAFRNLRNIAALEALQTAAFVQSKRGLVVAIVANNQHLFGLLRATLATEEPEKRAAIDGALRAHLGAKASEGDFVDEYFVVSPAGAVLGSSLANGASADLTNAQECLTQGKDLLTLGEFASVGGRTDLKVAAPIRDTAGGFLGVLCARFQFDIHRDLVMPRQEQTTRAGLFLLDGSGHVVSGSFENRAGVSHEQPVQPSVVGFAGRQEPWEGESRLDSGVDVFSAYAPVPALGWGVLVEIPRAEALADLERLKWQAILLGTLFSAALIAAVFATARGVTRPLKSLSDAAKRVAEGALGGLVPPGGPIETAELTAAFNRMSLALMESHETLEQRIVERTDELRKTKEFGDLLLNSIDQRVLVMDRDLRVLKANRSIEQLLCKDDLEGKTCHQLFGHESACESCPVTRAFATGRPESSERPGRASGDHEEILRQEAFPVFGASGKVEAVIEISRYVTAERQFLAQVMHHERMAAFGLLAAGVAHEIGNPLASIQSQLRMARENPKPEGADGTLAIVEKQVRRISDLLRELVSAVRRRGEEVSLIAIQEVVADVARLLSHDPRARSVQIEQQQSEGIGGVNAREDHLMQVLLNLGINALDAMPEGGTLVFETSVEGNQAVVRVRDSSGGVPEVVRKRLFQPFFTTKGPGRGTGLGLFVSRGVVESMGGTLELERSGADGTTFAVRLPMPLREEQRVAS